MPAFYAMYIRSATPIGIFLSGIDKIPAHRYTWAMNKTQDSRPRDKQGRIKPLGTGVSVYPLRVTRQVKQTAKKAAKREGLSLAEFVRRAMVKAAKEGL